MITNYANRQYQTVDVLIRRAWRAGLRSGEIATLPEPEAAKAIRTGFAELVKTRSAEVKKKGRPRKVKDADESV